MCEHTGKMEIITAITVPTTNPVTIIQKDDPNKVFGTL